jgi:hypothetical protein
MESITARNVNDAFPIGLMFLRESGVPRDSRNGPVIEMVDPVSIKYLEPTERVLFDSTRAINPFLHFFEPFWVLAGQNDVAFLANIVKQYNEYTDDGKTLAGAYGHRMMYPDDQIREAINILKRDPDSRRVVLQIRVPEDMWYNGKDVPCNTAVACKIRDGMLNIHVFNRSNDYIWGMTGANMPQFSVLQEYIAGKIGCGVGTYHQTTDSMHVYTELNTKWEECKWTSVLVVDPYDQGEVKPYEMFAGVKDPDHFDEDLFGFFEDGQEGLFRTPFFRDVFSPMWETFKAHKKDKTGLQYVDGVLASDWRKVTKRWLKERE